MQVNVSAPFIVLDGTVPRLIVTEGREGNQFYAACARFVGGGGSADFLLYGRSQDEIAYQLEVLAQQVRDTDARAVA